MCNPHTAISYRITPGCVCTCSSIRHASLKDSFLPDPTCGIFSFLLCPPYIFSSDLQMAMHLSIQSPVMLAASTTKNLSVIMTHKKLRIEQTYWKVLISLRWILNITFSDHSISALLKPSWSSYSWTAVKTRKSLTLSCQRYKVITINSEKPTIFPSTPQSANWRPSRPQLCFDDNKTMLIAQLKFLWSIPAPSDLLTLELSSIALSST